MNEARDANLTFTVANTSIDPYLKYIARDFPYSKAVVGGSITAVGPLAVPKELSVKVTATTVNLTLFAHFIQNDGDLVLSFDKNVFKLDRVRLKGVDTSLEMGGTIDATKRVSDLKANGRASLAVLSAFYPALNAQGEATLTATLTGDLDNPSLLGQATITDGRLRHEAMPQSFSNINGPIVMTAGLISVEGLRASLGEGAVQFFGGIRLDGFQPVEYDLRAEGTGMTLRYPEGLRSSVNARSRADGSACRAVAVRESGCLSRQLLDASRSHAGVLRLHGGRHGRRRPRRESAGSSVEHADRSGHPGELGCPAVHRKQERRDQRQRRRADSGHVRPADRDRAR